MTPFLNVNISLWVLLERAVEQDFPDIGTLSSAAAVQQTSLLDLWGAHVKTLPATQLHDKDAVQSHIAAFNEVVTKEEGLHVDGSRLNGDELGIIASSLTAMSAQWTDVSEAGKSFGTAGELQLLARAMSRFISLSLRAGQKLVQQLTTKKFIAEMVDYFLSNDASVADVPETKSTARTGGDRRHHHARRERMQNVAYFGLRGGRTTAAPTAAPTAGYVDTFLAGSTTAPGPGIGVSSFYRTWMLEQVSAQAGDFYTQLCDLKLFDVTANYNHSGEPDGIKISFRL